jgi:hypothetical protein
MDVGDCVCVALMNVTRSDEGHLRTGILSDVTVHAAWMVTECALDRTQVEFLVLQVPRA